MAITGISNLTYAKIASESEGNPITYDTGRTVHKLARADMTVEYNDEELYGDNVLAEGGDTISAVTLALETTALDDQAYQDLLGEKPIKKTGDTVDHYELTDEAAPYVGIGYIRYLSEERVPAYEAVWIHKIRFKLESENASTQKKNKTYETHKINGRGLLVFIDDTGHAKVRARMRFQTETAAYAWLKTKANIT